MSPSRDRHPPVRSRQREAEAAFASLASEVSRTPRRIALRQSSSVSRRTRASTSSRRNRAPISSSAPFPYFSNECCSFLFLPEAPASHRLRPRRRPAGPQTCRATPATSTTPASRRSARTESTAPSRSKALTPQDPTRPRSFRTSSSASGTWLVRAVSRSPTRPMLRSGAGHRRRARPTVTTTSSSGSLAGPP